MPNFVQGLIGSGGLPSAAVHNGGNDAAPFNGAASALANSNPYAAAIAATGQLMTAASKDPSVTSGGTFSGGKTTVNFGGAAGASGAGASLQLGNNSILIIAMGLLVLLVGRK